MYQDRSSAQADGQRKAIKFTIYTFLFCVVFAAAAGLIASMPERINNSAAKKLFSDRNLTESGETPVVKTPFTVCEIDNEQKWKYRGILNSSDLIPQESVTEKVRKARTCIFFWPDISHATKSNTYFWGTGNQKVKDAWFCPVYMTVIDREEGIRYKDIQAGTVPLSDRYRGIYSGTLYGGRWSTIKLDSWVKSHMEP